MTEKGEEIYMVPDPKHIAMFGHFEVPLAKPHGGSQDMCFLYCTGMAFIAPFAYCLSWSSDYIPHRVVV